MSNQLRRLQRASTSATQHVKDRRRDHVRCRYSDCTEQHPVASDAEQVTCATCRVSLGLPPSRVGTI